MHYQVMQLQRGEEKRLAPILVVLYGWQRAARKDLEKRKYPWLKIFVQHRHPGRSRSQGVAHARYRRVSLRERGEFSRMLAAGASLRAAGQALRQAASRGQ